MNDISEVQFDDVIFGGDLNAELDGSNELCRHRYSFIHDLQLNFVDDGISSDGRYTYRVVSTGACSTIDHFAVSQNLLRQIHDVQIVDSGDNLSDHCPLILKVDVAFSDTVPPKSSQFNSNVVRSFRWDSGDCAQYYMMTYNRLRCIEVPFFLLGNVSSAEMTRDYILNCVNRYYREIVSVLFDCSCACIPRKNMDFINFGGTRNSHY